MMINVIPVDDIGHHDELSTCPCGPGLEVVNGNMIITHNSYDGREEFEALGVNFSSGWETRQSEN